MPARTLVKEISLCLHSLTRAEVSSTLSSLDAHSGFRPDSVHLFPEYVVESKDSEECVRLAEIVASRDISATIYGRGAGNTNEVVVETGASRWSRVKAVTFGDEVAGEELYVSEDWIRILGSARVLPLLCYELYFPHFAAFFSGSIDLVLWLGTIQAPQIGRFREMAKTRAADFGCVVAGATYPLVHSPEYGRHRLCFVLHPENSVEDDVWVESSRFGPFLLPLGEGLRCSHELSTPDLFAKGEFGPCVEDLDTSIFRGWDRLVSCKGRGSR